MNYLQESFQKALTAIRDHKVWFSGLLALQLIFLVSFLFLALIYQAQVLQQAQGVFQSVQGANFDPNALQEGQPFLENALALSQSYHDLLRNILEMGLVLAGLFLLLDGILWISSHSLLQREKIAWKEKAKIWGKQWLKFMLSFVMVYGFIGGLGYVLFKLLIAQQVEVDFFGTIFKIIFYFFLTIQVLLLMAFALISAPSWREFLRQLIMISIKKFHHTLLILIINAFLLGGDLYFIYWSMDTQQPFYLLALFSLLLVLLMVLTRLFWIAGIQEIIIRHKNPIIQNTHETDHN